MVDDLKSGLRDHSSKLLCLHTVFKEFAPSRVYGISVAPVEPRQGLSCAFNQLAGESSGRMHDFVPKKAPFQLSYLVETGNSDQGFAARLEHPVEVGERFLRPFEPVL